MTSSNFVVDKGTGIGALNLQSKLVPNTPIELPKLKNSEGTENNEKSLKRENRYLQGSLFGDPTPIDDGILNRKKRRKQNLKKSKDQDL